MNSSTNHLKLREVINQVVNDPQYKEVAAIPLFSVHQIGLIIFAYACVFGGIFLHLSYDVTLWLIYPIIIMGFYVSFTPLHDACHKALSSNSFLNELLGSIAGFLLIPGANSIGYRYIHMTHHRYVGNRDMDPDELLVSLPTNYPLFGHLILLIPDLIWGYWLFFKVWKRTPTNMKWKSRKTITVDKNLTIIDALLLNNIKVEYTCLQGTCGTCIANVVEGEIDHRDSVLSEAEKIEGTKMCLCVSRAKSDKLIIDI